MMKYIDAHCHVLTDVEIRAATACGVGWFIMNATRPADWAAVVNMACRDNIYGAIGVHPWFVSGLSNDWDNKLVELLSTTPGLMVGEIGLDKNHPDMATQVSVFRRGLQIAHDFGRVAHVHCVGAWGACMDVLRTTELPPAMVFHAFSGAPEFAYELANLGAYFSFGAYITDTRRARVRKSVLMVPETRILVESDAPDGGTPDTIPNTVAEIAHIRGVDVEQMAEIIYSNTMGLLNGGQI